MAYDTPLTPAQEMGFALWRAKLPEHLQNMDDYDLRGAYLANAQSASNGHLPDTFKKPNHMTFSQESQYSTPAMQGGQWADAGKGRWNYWASALNMQQHPMMEMARYFSQQEPDSSVFFPDQLQIAPAEMTPEQRRARAYAAHALMNDPTLTEAWETIEAELIEEWAKPASWGDAQAKAQREALYIELQMLRRVRQKLANFAAHVRD